MCIKERNWSVEVDNDLSAYISGLQCTMGFITVLEQGVLFRTEEERAHTQKANTYVNLQLHLLKAVIFFLETLVYMEYPLTSNSCF